VPCTADKRPSRYFAPPNHGARHLCSGGDARHQIVTSVDELGLVPFMVAFNR
jgi:hypothetical protein